jgi:hypothetical protein
VGGAELACPFQLPVVHVDRDNRPRARQPRAEHRRVPDAAAADYRDGIAPGDPAGVDGRTQARHDTAAEQPGRRRGDRRVDPGALTGGDQRSFGEGADTEGR